MPILLNKTIRLFLDSIGRRDEYEYYLDKFRSEHQNAFALICPLGDDFKEAASVFTFDLSFLLRLELDPVILLCGRDALKIRNMLFYGQHPYSAYLVDISGKNIRNHTDDILQRLEECRQRAKILVLIDPSTPLEDALRQIVPTISQRIHFVRSNGALRAKSGDPLDYYYTRKKQPIDLDPADAALADMAGRLLNHYPKAHISVASPLHLLQELFTVKGAGCIIRTGSEIHYFHSIILADAERLTNLLERSFGRRLVRHDFMRRLSDLYIEHDYRGAALLEPYGSTMYLSKFAVDRDARGEGLAQELWERVAKNHKSVFWRSRADNRVNHWYEKLSDGNHTAGQWRVFWRGVSVAEIPLLIEFAVKQEQDFDQADEDNPPERNRE